VYGERKINESTRKIKTDDSSDERIVGQKLHQGFRLLTKPNPKVRKSRNERSPKQFCGCRAKEVFGCCDLITLYNVRRLELVDRKMKKNRKKFIINF